MENLLYFFFFYSGSAPLWIPWTSRSATTILANQLERLRSSLQSKLLSNNKFQEHFAKLFTQEFLKRRHFQFFFVNNERIPLDGQGLYTRFTNPDCRQILITSRSSSLTNINVAFLQLDSIFFRMTHEKHLAQ